MEYLVSGGAGFIGSHLVDKLIERGDSVTVIDDFSSGKEENLSCHKRNKKLFIYRKNICSNLTSIFKKKRFDVVFHFAALSRVQYSIQYPVKTHKVNVEGTLNILSLCKEFKVKKIIFPSSSSVYGEQKIASKEKIKSRPLSPYALQKLICEYYCNLFHALYGLDTVVLRYFNVFGPRQNTEGEYGFLIPKFIKLLHAGERPIIYGDGFQTRDFIYISDAVTATLLAENISRGNVTGKILNVGSGKGTSVNEVANAIIELSNKKITPLFKPPRNEPKHTLANISKIRKELRWEPKMSFREGLKNTYQYFVK